MHITRLENVDLYLCELHCIFITEAIHVSILRHFYITCKGICIIVPTIENGEGNFRLFRTSALKTAE